MNYSKTVRAYMFGAFALLSTLGVRAAEVAIFDEEQASTYASTFSIGVKKHTGAKATFSNLGTLASPFDSTINTAANDFTATYADGSVGTDNPLAGAGSASNITTNTWSAVSQAQDNMAGVMTFHDYSYTSVAGTKVEAESSGGQGFDIAYSLILGNVGKRFEWGIQGSLALGDIDAESSANISAVLQTKTITHTYTGNITSTATNTSTNYYTGRVITTNTTTVGNVTTSVQTDVSTRLAIAQASNTSANTATSVNGTWRINGAYYGIRVGPSARYKFSKHFSISGTVGIAFASGTSKFTYTETATPVTGVSAYQRTGSSDRTRSTVGLYGDLNLEYWVTDRTGFYLGYSYMDRSSYQQVTDGRVADIDLGSTKGLQAGVTFRF